MSYQFGKGLAQPEQFLDVDTHFFKMGRSTPLLLSWRSGAHTTAKAMIEDVLTIRADSDLAAAQKIHVYLNVFHDPLIHAYNACLLCILCIYYDLLCAYVITADFGVKYLQHHADMPTFSKVLVFFVLFSCGMGRVLCTWTYVQFSWSSESNMA
jgi:hypothetical protein